MPIKLEVISCADREYKPPLNGGPDDAPDPEKGGKWTADELQKLSGLERKRGVDAVRQRRNQWKRKEEKKFYEESYHE